MPVSFTKMLNKTVKNMTLEYFLRDFPIIGQSPAKLFNHFYGSKHKISRKTHREMVKFSAEMICYVS